MRYLDGRRRASERGLIPIAETAKLLEVTTRTVETWQSKGRMPIRKRFGQAFYYLRTDILNLRGTIGRRAGKQQTY